MMQAAPQFQPILRELGLDAETVFTHPLVVPWRRLADRENCLLQATLADGSSVRWHVKRYVQSKPMRLEVAGQRSLETAQIPTADLIAYGRSSDRRGFVIFDDLTGYQPLDKLTTGGDAFKPLIEPTAQLTARLHAAGLHHRDLYLCHFMGREQKGTWDLRLIDVARVKPLPRFVRRRWIVKDVAQFMYSATSALIPETQRDQWLNVYCAARGLTGSDTFRRAVARKQIWIARHDATLRRRQPHRNVSIPTS